MYEGDKIILEECIRYLKHVDTEFDNGEGYDDMSKYKVMIDRMTCSQ